MRRSRMRVSIFMINVQKSMGPGTSLMEHKFQKTTSPVVLKKQKTLQTREGCCFVMIYLYHLYQLSHEISRDVQGLH